MCVWMGVCVCACGSAFLYAQVSIAQTTVFILLTAANWERRELCRISCYRNFEVLHTHIISLRRTYLLLFISLYIANFLPRLLLSDGQR